MGFPADLGQQTMAPKVSLLHSEWTQLSVAVKFKQIYNMTHLIL